MKKLLVMAFIFVLPLSMMAETNRSYAKPQEQYISQSEVKFTTEFRKLWIEHVIWTSNYITSATTAGAEDQKDVLARLLKNQEDIGNAIKPVYGEEAGNKLTALLKEHIVLAGKIVEAAKKGNEALVKELNKVWYRNADDIAALLSKANPFLKNKELKELLYMHLKLVTDDLVSSLAKDWNGRIVSIDDGVTHIILMSDTISAGVVKQFPEKFKK